MHYQLFTYRGKESPRAALAVGGQSFDIAALSGNDRYLSMASILDDWQISKPLLDKIAAGAKAGKAIEENIEYLPPVLTPGAIYCAGANYRDHVDNMARIRGTPPEPDPHELGLDPWHFIKVRRCLAGHGAKVDLRSERLDWEGELALVIGHMASGVPVDKALDYVAAYTIGNDLSARDRIVRDKVDPSSPFKYDWIGQKCFDGSCPIGPWLVPADQIRDPQRLSIRTTVNGVVKQDSNTSKMLFTAAEQISYLSTRITLDPGDIILTGTPAGVGAETNERLVRGDEVCVEIESLGNLITYIV